jgi:hypothetical protein
VTTYTRLYSCIGGQTTASFPAASVKDTLHLRGCTQAPFDTSLQVTLDTQLTLLPEAGVAGGPATPTGLGWLKRIDTPMPRQACFSLLHCQEHVSCGPGTGRFTVDLALHSKQLSPGGCPHHAAPNLVPASWPRSPGRAGSGTLGCPLAAPRYVSAVTGVARYCGCAGCTCCSQAASQVWCLHQLEEGRPPHAMPGMCKRDVLAARQ